MKVGEKSPCHDCIANDSTMGRRRWCHERTLPGGGPGRAKRRTFTGDRFADAAPAQVLATLLDEGGATSGRRRSRQFWRADDRRMGIPGWNAEGARKIGPVGTMARGIPYRI
jgi:hypothetical protein